MLFHSPLHRSGRGSYYLCALLDVPDRALFAHRFAAMSDAFCARRFPLAVRFPPSRPLPDRSALFGDFPGTAGLSRPATPSALGNRRLSRLPSVCVRGRDLRPRGAGQLIAMSTFAPLPSDFTLRRRPRERPRIMMGRVGRYALTVWILHSQTLPV